ITAACQGMFLYAHVVLSNLLSQESVQELEDELTQDHFPQGLYSAFERVAIRITDRPAPPRRRTARKILALTSDIATDKIQENVTSGYYALQDYAVSCWQHPAQAVVTQPQVTSSTTSDAIASVTKLLHDYSIHFLDLASGPITEYCYAHDIGYPTQKELEAHQKRLHNEDTVEKDLFPRTTLKPKSAGKDKGTEVCMQIACEKGGLEEVKSLFELGVPLLSSRFGSNTKREHLTPFFLDVQGGHVLVCKYILEQYPRAPMLSQVHSSRESPLGVILRRNDLDLFAVIKDKWRPENDSFKLVEYYRYIIHLGSMEILDIALRGVAYEILEQNWLRLINALLWTTWEEKEEKLQPNAELLNKLWYHVMPWVDIEKPGQSTPGPKHLHHSEQWRSLWLRTSWWTLDHQKSWKYKTTLAALCGRVIWNTASVSLARCCLKMDGGASLDISDSFGDNSPMLACRTCHFPELLRMLIQKTKNLNHTNYVGESALATAAMWINLEATAALLASGRVDILQPNPFTKQSVLTQLITVRKIGVFMPDIPAIWDMLYEAEPSIAWLTDETDNRVTPLHYALFLSEASQSRSGHVQFEAIVKRFLSLPEVHLQHVVDGFLASPVQEILSMPPSWLRLPSKTVSKTAATMIICDGKLDLSHSTSLMLGDAHELLHDNPDMFWDLHMEQMQQKDPVMASSGNSHSVREMADLLEEQERWIAETFEDHTTHGDEVDEE
ncbi:hypothetical protein QBC35DRAFT_478994, partial [Podospora australis]